METSRRNPFPGSFRMLFEVGTVAGMSDGQLLDRFLARRTIGPEAAEIAFGALVERHGPMVLRVCRGRLGDEHDAQDAFQATFLILARKAGSIRNRDSAASWLQGVARRVAACARRASAVRRAKERAASRSDVESPSNSDAGELVPAVREEVGDLPEKYRTPLMLCLLDGLTHEEAATRLGWPVGTVKTRVRQAKDRLRTRLTRRGFAPTLGAIAASLTAREVSALPLSLVRSTARAALRFASGKSMTAGAASASVATLVQMGIGSLLMSRIKIVALVVAAFGAFTAGSVGYARQGQGQGEKAEPVKVIKTEVQDKATESILLDKLADAIDKNLQRQLDLDQAESLKIDVDMLKNEVQQLQQAVSQSGQDRLNAEAALRKLNGPFPTDLRGNPMNAADTEERKKYQQSLLEANELELKTSRALYLTKNRELKEKQTQLVKLQERETERLSAETKKHDEAEQASDSNQLDQMIAARMKLDMLRSEFEFWKNRVFSTREASLDLQKQARNDRRPYGMTEKEFEAEKKSLQQQINDVQQEEKKADHNFQEKSDLLVVSERELRDLEKGLSPVAQAQYNRWKTGMKPTETARTPADVDRRLSDLERKLDLILKTLEARPAGK